MKGLSSMLSPNRCYGLRPFLTALKSLAKIISLTYCLTTAWKKSRHDFKEILLSVTGSPADVVHVQVRDQVWLNSHGKSQNAFHLLCKNNNSPTKNREHVTSAWPSLLSNWAPEDCNLIQLSKTDSAGFVGTYHSFHFICEWYKRVCNFSDFFFSLGERDNTLRKG